MRLEVYRRVDGKWAWRLLATNGRIIATDGGQGYSHKAECRAIAEAVVGGLYSSSIEQEPEGDVEMHEVEPAPEYADDVAIDARGVLLNGERLPFLISDQVVVTEYDDDHHTVEIGIFTRSFRIIEKPAHGTITTNYARPRPRPREG